MEPQRAHTPSHCSPGVLRLTPVTQRRTGTRGTQSHRLQLTNVVLRGLVRTTSGRTSSVVPYRQQRQLRLQRRALQPPFRERLLRRLRRRHAHQFRHVPQHQDRQGEFLRRDRLGHISGRLDLHLRETVAAGGGNGQNAVRCASNIRRILIGGMNRRLSKPLCHPKLFSDAPNLYTIRLTR